MSILDRMLASGYYVFDGNLNYHLVRAAFNYLRKAGMSFKREDLVMQEINQYMYFDIDSKHYVLREGYTVSHLNDFVDKDLMTLFHNLKKSWDFYHSRRIDVVEPTFESAMKKIKRM